MGIHKNHLFRGRVKVSPDFELQRRRLSRTLNGVRVGCGFDNVIEPQTKEDGGHDPTEHQSGKHEQLL